MGFRFSKRIKLMPGVRVNISKSGASLSVGPRGASVTMGKRGVYGNVGIPGSGLSYRERLDRPASAKARPQLPERIEAVLDGDEIRFADDRGAPIDPALLPAARRAMKAKIAALLEQHVAARNAPIDTLLALHHDVPAGVGAARQNPAKPQREAYASDQAHIEAVMLWRAEAANAGHATTGIEEELLASLGALEFPRETDIALELRGDRLLLDVDLPELEEMPTSRWVANIGYASLIAKAMSQKDVAALYLGHVTSLILRLIGHGFSVSSDIRSVAVSAYTQRCGSTGQLADEYVAVAEIDRTGWNQVDCANMRAIDPENLLRRFGAKLEANSRGILKVQQPFD